MPPSKIDDQEHAWKCDVALRLAGTAQELKDANYVHLIRVLRIHHKKKKPWDLDQSVPSPEYVLRRLLEEGKNQGAPKFVVQTEPDFYLAVQNKSGTIRARIYLSDYDSMTASYENGAAPEKRAEELVSAFNEAVKAAEKIASMK